MALADESARRAVAEERFEEMSALAKALVNGMRAMQVRGKG